MYTDGVLLYESDWLSDKLLSLKRLSKQKVKSLGKEAQVLKENKVIKSLSPSTCVPQVLCTCADQAYAGILLKCMRCLPLASILRIPLSEPSALFFAASVITLYKASSLRQLCALRVLLGSAVLCQGS